MGRSTLESLLRSSSSASAASIDGSGPPRSPSRMAKSRQQSKLGVDGFDLAHARGIWCRDVGNTSPGGSCRAPLAKPVLNRIKHGSRKRRQCAAIGSVIPGAGTAVGLVVGAGVGAVAAWGGSKFVEAAWQPVSDAVGSAVHGVESVFGFG